MFDQRFDGAEADGQLEEPRCAATRLVFSKSPSTSKLSIAPKPPSI